MQTSLLAALLMVGCVGPESDLDAEDSRERPGGKADDPGTSKLAAMLDKGVPVVGPPPWERTCGDPWPLSVSVDMSECRHRAQALNVQVSVAAGTEEPLLEVGPDVANDRAIGRSYYLPSAPEQAQECPGGMPSEEVQRFTTMTLPSGADAEVTFLAGELEGSALLVGENARGAAVAVYLDAPQTRELCAAKAEWRKATQRRLSAEKRNRDEELRKRAKAERKAEAAYHDAKDKAYNEAEKAMLERGVLAQTLGRLVPASYRRLEVENAAQVVGMLGPEGWTFAWSGGDVGYKEFAWKVGTGPGHGEGGEPVDLPGE